MDSSDWRLSAMPALRPGTRTRTSTTTAGWDTGSDGEGGRRRPGPLPRRRGRGFDDAGSAERQRNRWLSARYTGFIMTFINKYRTPIVWLVVIAMVASIGAGFFVTIF